jgi:hypothetical protein
VLEGLRLVVAEQGDGEDPQDRPAVRERDVGTDALADLDADAEFLDALAGQGLLVGLAGLDLAAGKFPPAGRLGWRGSLARQHATIRDDHRRNDYFA